MAFAEVEGGFEGFEEAGLVGRGDFDAVLDDLDFRFQVGDLGRFVGAEDLSVMEDAEVSLGVEEGEEIVGGGVVGDGDGKSDECGFATEVMLGPIRGGVRSVGADFLVGFRIVGVREAGEEQLEVVVDFGERADGGAGGANVVLLLDGDGGRNALDGVHEGFVHAVEKLPDVG